LQIDDVLAFAADAITDHGNDKKLDLCFIDENDGRVIIAQNYFSSTWGKTAAPANKASDLNTAIAWLFSASEDQIPINLKAKAQELRQALSQGTINQIEIMFVHNCYESDNVGSELKATTDITRDLVNRWYSVQGDPIIVTYQELGLRTIEELYRSRDSDILIDRWIEVPAANWIIEQEQDWRALVMSVPGDWIRSLRLEHGDRLYSANFRDYLGAVRRKGNINHQIKQTIVSEPDNFWVFNNGITALTREVLIDESDNIIRIRGISIINGAQTSGAIGESEETNASETKVLLRVVECESQGLIDKIILYNNTQNEIKPSDTRSNDSIQRRLSREFSQKGVTYVHRRSTTRNPRNSITAANMARILCAFHGDPQTSYRNARDIFEDNAVYRKVFPNNICIEHVFLINALSTAIDKIKRELKIRIADENATELEQKQYEVLKYSASKHFLLFIIGAVAEEIMNRRISNKYEWKCNSEIVSTENVSLIREWEVTLRAIMPLLANLIQQQGEGSAYEIPRSAVLSKEIAQNLKALLASLESALGGQFDGIRRRSSV
jgi:hypothetical protein